MIYANLVAVAMLGALVVYAVLGGADFGGGVWDMFASGPRAAQQRRLIEHALAPVWEANHVWLVVVAVLTFSAFPNAFAVAGIALHVPLSLLLLGIVFRGTAFAFRQYGTPDRVAQRRWGTVFASASIITPFFLGVCVGAVTAGEIRVKGGIPVTGFFEPWIGFFQFMVGLMTLALFAFLAAVYLAHEADDPKLKSDFRARALLAAVAVGVFAELVALTVPPGARHFTQTFFNSWWTWPLQIAAGVCAVGVFGALYFSKFRLARPLAITQVALIIVGWALGQRPFIIAPDVTLENAAAPEVSLKVLLVAAAIGLPILVPSLYWLMKVFKYERKPAVEAVDEKVVPS